MGRIEAKKRRLPTVSLSWGETLRWASVLKPNAWAEVEPWSLGLSRAGEESRRETTPC